MLSGNPVSVHGYLFFILWGMKCGLFVRASVVLSAINPMVNNLATLATIPTSCNDTCNAIETTISDCLTVECVCTSSNGNALTTCVDCLEAVKPNQTVISQAQDILNQFAALCDAGGISVPVQTASGFSGSVGLPLSTASVSVVQTTNTGSGGSVSSFSDMQTQTSSALTAPEISTLAQSTQTSSSLTAPSSASVVTATAPGSSSQTSSTQNIQSTVTASVASTSSGSSSTTIASSSATKVLVDHRSFAALGASLLLGLLGSCLVVF